MEYTDLLTIAIPCYERKEYFLEALESALNQTVKCKVIVVDNNSSHSFFKDVCKEKGITYYKNETNIGLFPNINRCYELAETKYVKILDDDDLLLPEYTRAFLETVSRHPDIDVYFTNYQLFSSDKNLKHHDIFPYGYMKTGDKISEFGIKYGLNFPYVTATVRKEISILDLDKEWCAGGYDWEWIYSKAEQLTFYGESRALHKFRMHNNRASTGKDWIANLITIPYIYDTILKERIINRNEQKGINKIIKYKILELRIKADKDIISNIIESDNRFGQYLKKKLNDDSQIGKIMNLSKPIAKVNYLSIRIIKSLKSRMAYLKYMVNVF